MQDWSENIKLALPPHLTEADKKKLLAQLRDFPDQPSSYFGIVDDAEPVQGDAWRGFVAIDFESGERDSVVGMVISNSCDLAALNNPTPDQRILFAPVISLDAYGQVLREGGAVEDYVISTLDQIRRQEVSRIFYIPRMGDLLDESLVLLDDLHAQPLSSLRHTEMTRLFSLSNFGWYVFLVKLSVHFTRMTDGVKRAEAKGPDDGSPASAAAVVAS